jgi:stage II sporulation protein D
MKQAIYLTLLIIAIPFFVVIFTFTQEQPKTEEEEKKDNFFVRVKREKSNKIETVELENYVVGVLAGEMPISFHIEALKAQAVAARSYVLKRASAIVPLYAIYCNDVSLTALLNLEIFSLYLSFHLSLK